MNKEISLFLKNNPGFIYLEEHKRIKCELTKHELLPKIEALTAYLNTTKYKMAVANSFDFKKYEPNIIPSKQNPKKLYCKLTEQTLNRIPEEIEKHINGKKYKLALKKMEEEKEMEEEQKDEDGNDIQDGEDGEDNENKEEDGEEEEQDEEEGEENGEDEENSDINELDDDEDDEIEEDSDDILEEEVVWDGFDHEEQESKPLKKQKLTK